MQRLKMPEGEPIEHPIVNRSIAKAQNRVESRNFDIRKQLLEYDDVANDQRRVIYQQRNELLESDRHRGHDPQHDRRPDRRDGEALHPAGIGRGAVGHPGPRGRARRGVPDAGAGRRVAEEPIPRSPTTTVRERLTEAALAQYASKEAQVGPELMRQFERSLMLQTLDQHWRDHLANLDHLRQGIHLRGYAQKNPKQEYKRESFELFSDMLDRIKQDVVKIVLTVQVRTPEDVQAVEEAPPVTNVRYQHADYDEALAAGPGGRCRRAGRGAAVRARAARRSAATIPVRAARARSTSSATAGSP